MSGTRAARDSEPPHGTWCAFAIGLWVSWMPTRSAIATMETDAAAPRTTPCACLRIDEELDVTQAG